MSGFVHTETVLNTQAVTTAGSPIGPLQRSAEEINTLAIM